MFEKLVFETINPFEYWLPNRNIISRDTLLVVKQLRQDGYNVEIKGQEGRPVEYLFRKGVRELFTDPIYVTFITSGFSLIGGIAANLISNAVQKVLDRKGNNTSKADKNIIIDLRNRYYNINGDALLDGYVIDKKKKDRSIQKSFVDVFSQKSPYIDAPIPMLIEHKPKICGWCVVTLLDKTFYIKNGKITDKKVRKQLEQGKLKGGSLTGIAHESICSICNSNYVNCKHIAGDIYEGIECTNRMLKSTPIEVSLVKEPINPRCLVELI